MENTFYYVSETLGALVKYEICFFFENRKVLCISYAMTFDAGAYSQGCQFFSLI